MSLLKKLDAITQYLATHYIDEDEEYDIENYDIHFEIIANYQKDIYKKERKGIANIKDFISDNESEMTFTKMLLNLIDEKGYLDVEVYKKALIDRRHFSKIRSNLNYRPTKQTVLAFILALELDLDKATDLLMIAGYSFCNNSKYDLIIKYCIIEKIYDLNEVNLALHYFEQPLLKV